MSKWKCEICEKEFDNFHAQGFDNKIYCPLCFFKEKTNRLEKENKKYKEVIDKLNNKINSLKTCEDKPKEDIIYPHWEICNETKQEMLDILKEVK